MSSFLFSTSELLHIECPLQPSNGSGCRQQTRSGGCPFGHRSSAVEAAISRQVLHPLPEHICIEHLLTSGHCGRPVSSAQVHNSSFFWCHGGFHPQNAQTLATIGRAQKKGKFSAKNDAACNCHIDSNGAPGAQAPPSLPKVLALCHLKDRSSSSVKVAPDDEDDLVEDLDLNQGGKNVVVNIEVNAGHNGKRAVGNNNNADNGETNSPVTVGRSCLHLSDKCITGFFCFFACLMFLLLHFKPAQV